MPTLDDLLRVALPQAGKPYKFGFEVNLDDPNPPAFDCSEIWEWSAHQIGLVPPLPDGSWNQCTHVRDHGLLLTVENAIATPGALLFKFSDDPFTGIRPKSAHVALSLGIIHGQGRTFEARSTGIPVGEFSSAQRGWTHAGLIPGLIYPTKQPPAASSSGSTNLLPFAAALAIGAYLWRKSA